MDRSLSTYQAVLANLAHSFYNEVKKIDIQGNSKLEAIMVLYETISKRQCECYKKEVEDLWKFELKRDSKCKQKSCCDERIMYSFFCKAHTQELLAKLDVDPSYVP